MASDLLDDLPPVGVVTGRLHDDVVTHEQADNRVSKFARGSGEHGFSVLETHSEECFGPDFDDDAADSTFAFRYESSNFRVVLSISVWTWIPVNLFR